MAQNGLTVEALRRKLSIFFKVSVQRQKLPESKKVVGRLKKRELLGGLITGTFLLQETIPELVSFQPSNDL